ncbi:MAG: hypothetical protein IPJ38_16605 [Dechloromonas sp.]|uniref:DNA topoisomerase type IA zn finger domain-containing protein n=1 Tax=Candidatus Dechloromonas phosphorivorans TaxID=2899244 RepID=A0A935KD31_9RHOO|nr:hypothetical protein [Candidatus Dechloromonas phosphorivorans]
MPRKIGKDATNFSKAFVLLPVFPDLLSGKSTYTLAEISASIANAMGAKIEPSDVTAPTTLGDVNVSAIKQDFDVVQKIDSGPDCPRCSSQMVRRMAKSGENAGKEFWGCTNFRHAGEWCFRGHISIAPVLL